MEKLDLEAMRSKYSDLTVTAIPKGAAQKDATKLPHGEPNPHVEITRIAVDRPKENYALVAAAPVVALIAAPVAAQAIDDDEAKLKASHAYRKEYAAAVARLEEVLFQQAQLAKLKKALPFHVDGLNAITNLELWEGYPGVLYAVNHPGMSALNSNTSINIEKKYNELLDVVNGMRRTIPLCMQGLRIPKERLQVEINNARGLIRECKAILEHDM